MDAAQTLVAPPGEYAGPTRRRVHLVGQDGAAMPEPVVVTIDLDDVRFE